MLRYTLRGANSRGIDTDVNSPSAACAPLFIYAPYITNLQSGHKITISYPYEFKAYN